MLNNMAKQFKSKTYVGFISLIKESTIRLHACEHGR